MVKIMIVLASILSLFGCQSPANGHQNDTITYFSLTKGGGMNRFSGYRYSVKETQEGLVRFRFDEGYPDEKEFTIDDHSVFDSLLRIVNKYKMYNYHGFYKPEFDILDGHSWHLDITYASGKTVGAHGYMAGPAGYGDAFYEIRQCLDQWKTIPVANNDINVFVYEYGPERYRIERKEDHALLIVENEETDEHQELERSLQLLENLRIFINVHELKRNDTRGNLDFEFTPWMYEIDYANGEHYHNESYDRDFRCGDTEWLQGFISHWLKDPKKDTIFYY